MAYSFLNKVCFAHCLSSKRRNCVFGVGLGQLSVLCSAPSRRDSEVITLCAYTVFTLPGYQIQNRADP